MKICSKAHQIASFNFFSGKHASEHPSKRLEHATRTSPKKLGPLCKSCIRPWPIRIGNLFEDMRS